MKEKTLIAVVIFLVVSVFAVRYQFKVKLDEFKTSVSNYESEQREFLKKQKDEKLKFIFSDSIIYQIFIKEFDEKKAIAERDTNYSFLYLSENIKYATPISNYVECFYQKCLVDKKNKEIQSKIDFKADALEKKYGDTFTLWYSKLKEDKLIQKIKMDSNCIGAVGEINEINYSEDKWKDFEKFLITYSKENKNMESANKKVLSDYDRLVSSTKGQFKSNVVAFFTSNLLSSQSSILKKESFSKEFNSEALGTVNYTLEKTSIDKAAFQSVVDVAFEEQWKNNSLSNGAMPYAYCYGSSNYCGDYNCSKIAVQTGSYDVLVTIKNDRGSVIRHAYIKGGKSFTFSVTDGEYQVFFYSGEGWNPNKYMATTSCGTLRGGFVSGESFSKDNYISLNSQIMRYELILQQNGNLSTQPSSKNEAF